MGRLTLFLLAVLLLGKLQAQSYIDLAKFHYANTPVNQFDSVTNGTRVQEWGLDLLTPVPLKNGNAFLTGAYVEGISTKVAPENSNLTAVYTLNLKLGMMFKHGEKWSGSYFLLPKLSSDMKNVGRQDFQLGGIALLKYNKREKFNYKAGLYYNGEMFGAFFVPILGLYYQSENEKTEVNLLLPISADINHQLKPWVSVGANYNSFVRTFHLNEPYKGNPDNYLTKSTTEAFAYLQFQPTKSLVIQTKLGYSIGRNYRIYDVSDKIVWGLSAFKFGDDRKQLNPDFNDGLVFRLRLLYRLAL